jgi:glutathione peroxidase-family protein
MAAYTPANAAYAKTALTAKLTAMKAAQDAELAAQVALSTARDAAAAAEWDFHNFMLAAKEQVIAQFGKSSDQVQSLGLKKKTEYKAPARRVKVVK